ncbi:TIGR00341 family protein [Minwuia sp.]|uniref:TIGR00341 family protein n=1 Tax=Minwuia sp. TaxID=2493630 RepID=UPI003A92B06D
MTARIIEVIAEDRQTERIRSLSQASGADDVIVGALTDDGRRVVRIACGTLDRQKLLDALQMTLSTTANWRIIILPVEATLPMLDEDKHDTEKAKKKRITGGLSREELGNQIARGAELDKNFGLLVALSAVVATIGLMEDNVAVVIGAMVIAPLLGPNLALAFGSAVGDFEMIRKAMMTNAVGVALTLAFSIGIGLLFEINLDSEELLSRTSVNLSSIAVALASGSAAALSLTTGLSATLVGVMVAVALLPPAATVGILLGWQQFALAAEALLLLAVNVVCVNLSAQVVFRAKGIRPRTWFEAEKAKWSTRINMGIWAGLLIGLALIIIFNSNVGEELNIEQLRQNSN